MHAAAAPVEPQAAPERALLGDASIEITSRDVGALAAAAALLAPGTRVSVTYLPGETTAQRLAAVQAVLAARLRPVPHISARRLASADELETYLEALADLGAAQDLFIVAGDPDTPMGPYEDALAVIRSGMLERYGVERVGIGGYPEGHPKIDEPILWQALGEKARAVADQGLALSIVTQFGFDPEPAVRWASRVRHMGIEAPIRIGVPGPASAATLLRFAARCGVGASAAVLRKYGLSVGRLMRPAGPDRYVRGLAEGFAATPAGDIGLHLYPFGGIEAAARWIAGFGATGSHRG